MTSMLDLALRLTCETLNGVRQLLSAPRKSGSAANHHRACPQVETLEGRIALSRAPVIHVAHHAAARVRALPEKDSNVVNIPIELPPGFGWFLEVRRIGAPKSRWQWKGPFGDPTQVRSKLRKQGFAVRGSFLHLPDMPQQPPDAPPPPAPDDGPENTDPQQITGYEVKFWGVDSWGFGAWRSLSPREIYISQTDASNRARWRDATFYPYRHTVFQVTFNESDVIVSNGQIYPRS